MKNVQNTWNSLISELRQISREGPERPIYYQRLPDLLGKSSELILYDDIPESTVDLVHYTTWDNVLEMFKEKDKKKQEAPIIRMYNYEQSNDPEEGQIKLPEWEKIEKEARSTWIDDILKNGSRRKGDMALELNTYGCSFSSGSSGVEDDLTYWRLYGNDGRGCSLKISRLSERIYKVRYRDKNDFDKRTDLDKKEDKEVAERLSDIFDVGKSIVQRAPEDQGKTKEILAEGLLRILYWYYHLIKHIDYEREKEWRMIRVMPRPDAIRFDTSSGNIIKRYVEGPPLSQLLSSASAITVGPTVPNRGAARAYLEYLAKEVHNIPYVNVKNSSQNYRQV